MTGWGGWDFAAPLAFALLPLPLAAMLWRRTRFDTPGGLRIPASVVERLRTGTRALPPPAYRRISAALAALAWTALVIALAGPRAVAATPAVPASGRDIVFAFDLSGSMVAEDFMLDGRPASRIDALRRVGAEMIRRRTGDRIGLVVFAEKAYAAAPLSFDVATVSRTLAETPLGLVGHSTAIGEGLGLALKRLSDSKAPSRIIILLSDGANDAGTTDPVGVAELARDLGVRIYTIGLGVNDTQNPNGDRDPVDFLALQRLAEIGGGEAFRVRTTQDLAAAAAAIETLVAGELVAPPAVVHREFWPYAAGLSLLACVAMAAFRTRPR
jgi:Ca-activated chloride channel family protein